MKYILAACPIHTACPIQVIFGEDKDARIPYPDPTLKPLAERDFPDLVPIEVEHRRTQRAFSAR